MNTTITTPEVDRQAPAPSKATASITLTAGALVVPLSIYTAIETLAVARHERLDGNPAIEVGRTSIRKDTGEVITTGHVTRMAEATDGTWVTVDDAELASVYGDTGQANVVSFVPVAEAQRYTLDGIMQVRAKRDKKASAQAANDTAFSLLLAGMQAAGVHALIRFVLRGGPRFGLLTASGDLLTIIPAEAVRAALPLPEVQHTPQALELIGQFINAVGVKAEPVNDATPVEVQAFIDGKAATHGVRVGDAPAEPASAPVVIDMMAALTASIEAAKVATPKRATAARKAGVAK
jgi:non-homologous end joining protein Ku